MRAYANAIQESRLRTSNAHFGALLFYFMALGVLTVIYSHPLYLGSLFLVVAAGIILANGLSRWKHALIFSLLMAVFIVAINVFISRSGNTVIFETNPLPLYGKITITKESLVFSLIMGIKLALIVSLFCWYDLVASSDQAFSFFSRFAPTSALVVILTSLFIPRLKRRLNDARDALILRGAAPQGGSLRGKVISLYPLLKVLLVSSLENSWATAEALQARSFGTGKRTYYERKRWTPTDTFLTASILCAVFTAGVSYWTGAAVQFYPSLLMPTGVNDALLCIVLISFLLVFPFIQLSCHSEFLEVSR